MRFLSVVCAFEPFFSKGECITSEARKGGMMRVLSYARTTMLVATLGLTGGCALTNPYIDFNKYGRDKVGTNATVELSEAIKYATQTKDAYRAALGDRAEFRNILGIGLIPLTSAAFALGVSNVDENIILGLGTAGATAFGVGSWINNTPAERAYILGYNAINCTIDAVEPFRLATDDPDYSDFKAGLNDIDMKIEAAQKQIGTVRGHSVKLPKSQAVILAQLNNSVTAAETVIANAVTIRRNGVSIRRGINLTGSRLIDAVDRISGEIDLIVLDNSRDIQTLAEIIGKLGQVYQTFTTVPEGMKASDDVLVPSTSGQQSLSASTRETINEAIDALTTLQNNVAALSSSSRKIGDFVNAVSGSKPQEALAACGVNAEGLAGDIEVEPQGAIELTAKVKASEGRVIVGGRSPYRATIVGTAPGITVIQPELFGPAFAVQGDENTEEGSYTILVADGANHRKTIKVEVKVSSTDQNLEDNNQTLTVSEFGRKLPKDDVTKVQEALCMPQNTGNWLELTDAAFFRHKARIEKERGTKETDEALIGDLIAKHDAGDLDCPDKVDTSASGIPNLQAFTDELYKNNKGLLIDVVGGNQTNKFAVKSKPVLDIDKKLVAVELEHKAGSQPDEDVGIAMVKDALRSAASDTGSKVTNDNISISNESEVLGKLRK